MNSSRRRLLLLLLLLLQREASSFPLPLTPIATTTSSHVPEAGLPFALAPTESSSTLAPPHRSSGGASHVPAKIPVITGLTISCVALLLLCGAIVIWRQNATRLAKPSNAASKLQEPDVCASPAFQMVAIRSFKFEELRVATNNFDERNILGEGGFAKVYMGTISDPQNTRVAIKHYRVDSKQASKEFNTEVQLLRRLRHKNLVKLLGYCVNGEQKLLVYEQAANGNLYDHLHYGRAWRNEMPWAFRLKIAVGTARGIDYLHRQDPQVLHCDIKAANILLTKRFTAKICDFGFAKQASKPLNVCDQKRFCCTPSRSGANGTLGYVAPETFMTGEVSGASDVYSFGVLLLELLTGRKPLDVSRPEKEQSLVIWVRKLCRECLIDNLIDPFLENLLSDPRSREFMQLFLRTALACLDMDPHLRPSMSQVMHVLDTVRKEQSRILESCIIDFSDTDLEEEEIDSKAFSWLKTTTESSEPSLCDHDEEEEEEERGGSWGFESSHTRESKRDKMQTPRPTHFHDHGKIMPLQTFSWLKTTETSSQLSTPTR